MWLVIEGADGAGKTTLARASAELTEAELTHLGPPRSPESALDECISDQPYGTYLPGEGSSLVSDRLHWGCVVYGPIYRPEDDQDGWGDFGAAGWRYAELYLESRGVVTVLVDVEPEIASNRVMVRGDDYVNPLDLPAIIAKYRWLASDSITGCCVVKMEDESQLDETLELVTELAIEKERRHAPLAQWRHYVGQLEPARLVVCRPDRQLRLDVVGELDGDSWQTCGIASATASGDSLELLWRHLGEPALVGLGRIGGEQEHWLDAHGGVFVNAVGELRSLTS